MTAAERPRQLMKAEMQLRKRVCTGSTQVANYLVGLGENWAHFEALGSPKDDGIKRAVVVEGIRHSLPGTFQVLVPRPELDYAGLCSGLVSTTSYIGEKEEEVPLRIHATIACTHCEKPGPPHANAGQPIQN